MDRKLLLVCLLLFTVISFGCISSKSFPLKGLGLSKCEVNRSYTEEVPYQTLEYYIEKVPYIHIEYASEKQPYELQAPYTEKQCVEVPYIGEECQEDKLAYSVTDQKCYVNGWEKNFINIECKVTNLDSKGGSFIIYAAFASSNQPWYNGNWGMLGETGENETVYLYPGSSKTFQYNHEVSSPDTPYVCFCNAIPLSTREVCSTVEKTRQVCQEVTKYKTLTEYKTVTDLAKNTTVTRYRNETNSRLVTKYRTGVRYQISEENC